MLFEKVMLNITIINYYVLSQRLVIYVIPPFLSSFSLFLYVDLSYMKTVRLLLSYFVFILYLWRFITLFILVSYSFCFGTSLNAYIANTRWRIEAVNLCGGYSSQLEPLVETLSKPYYYWEGSNNLINPLGNLVSHSPSITSWLIRSRYNKIKFNYKWHPSIEKFIHIGVVDKERKIALFIRNNF